MRDDPRGTRPGGAEARRPASWPARYEIQVDAVLDRRWTDCLSGIRMDTDDTTTTLTCRVDDQPSLHALLTIIRDLGLCLIAVRRLDAADPDPKKHS